MFPPGEGGELGRRCSSVGRSGNDDRRRHQAIAQDDMKRILAFHIISQIGYMIMGLGLFTVVGVAAAVFYVIHHIVVKTALFLVAGLVDHRAGSSPPVLLADWFAALR